MNQRKKNKSLKNLEITSHRACDKLSSVIEKVFISGSHHFDALLKDINRAKSHIDLETYIYQNDQVGSQITRSLIDAAQRGVKIRVMVDGAGSPYWATNIAKMLENAGVSTKVFHPFPWQLWNWSRAVVKLPITLKWIYFLLKWNLRNHRKVCIIDQKIAYIGSHNISKCHLERSAGGSGWRDTSVRLENINLSELSQAFDIAWSHRTINQRLRETLRHVKNEPVIRLNYTRHRRRIFYKNLLRRIKNCKTRIWITNAYFIPDNFLLRRLKEAASNGLDVRILLPKNSDIFFVPPASSTFYHDLLQAGVRVFEYLPSILHAKTLILDDWALVGSSNLNHRSLLHDLEADIVLQSRKSRENLVKQFLSDLQNSSEVFLEKWKKIRRPHYFFLGRLALLFKYLM